MFSFLDAISIALIILLVVLVSIRNVPKGFSNIFKENGKLYWVIGSSSLLVIFWNPTIDMINTNLVIEKGYSGIWFTKDFLLTIGIAPILFVPMWARLKLTTDNQLIPLRYSGIGAKVLQIFRAIYVGVFIASFVISFYILGIRKILNSFLEITDSQFLIFGCFGMILIILKNSFRQKVRTDIIITILYLLVPITSIGFLVFQLGGWATMKTELISSFADKISLLPTDSSKTESFSNWFVFIFIQWWSVRLLDHSNPNTQRYFAIDDSWKAFKAIFYPILIISIMFGLSSFVWDAALLANSSFDSEGLYVKLLLNASPNGLKGLLIATFVFGFITTLESVLNWGASMICIDVIQTHVNKDISKPTLRFWSYFTMGIMSIHCIDHLFVLRSTNCLAETSVFNECGCGFGFYSEVVLVANKCMVSNKRNACFIGLYVDFRFLV